ncbi:MAG: Gfo/Idh/MocA family oxidoreductase [Elusimicrobiota bacterium]|nr:Gfo/Idh/MocA family oxidoreductase [Elusimicrobiota bacterium]
MKDKKLKGAIIGFGEVVKKAHVPAFLSHKDSFEITAIVDNNPETLNQSEEYYPKAARYSSLEALLDNEKNLDFVDIASPPMLHAKLIRQVLNANIHVLCEKPLVLDTGEFEEIKKLSKEKNLCLFTVHNWNNSPQMLKIKEILDSNILGNIHYGEFHTLRQRPSISSLKGWRKNPKLSGGGILIDHGWHVFYLIMNMLRKKPLSISAKLEMSKEETPVDEIANCKIHFEKASATIHLSWKSPVRKNTAAIYGDKGLLLFHDNHIVLENQEGREEIKFETGLSQGSAHPEWMTSLLGDFIKELENPEIRETNLREAETCLKLIKGALKSHSSNYSAIEIN